MTELALRTATIGDARLLWSWRNDPETRRNSFRDEPVPWETHVAWLSRRLSDPFSRMLLVLEGTEPVVLVRFDRSGADEAEVHITVAPAHRGQGLAARALRRAAEDLLTTAEVRRLLAHVKQDNPASCRAFEKAGYRRLAIVTVDGHEAIRYAFEIPPLGVADHANP